MRCLADENFPGAGVAALMGSAQTRSSHGLQEFRKVDFG
jgi:hypothetical protein